VLESEEIQIMTSINIDSIAQKLGSYSEEEIYSINGLCMDHSVCSWNSSDISACNEDESESRPFVDCFLSFSFFYV